MAVDAFHKASGDERADVCTRVQGLDQLIGAGATVINLSLSGPPNTVLEDTLAAIEAAETAQPSAVAFEQRAQGDARPQLGGQEVNAADLAVQKQRGGGRHMGEVPL